MADLTNPNSTSKPLSSAGDATPASSEAPTILRCAIGSLIAGGFALLDTQFVTDHLRSLGADEMPRARYRVLLDQALTGNANFNACAESMTGAEALAFVAQHRA